ncbi:hypothetical protein QFZ58_004992 [Streptomyces sp. B1I3]|nr:hypothetical protein [Streptomyces sp. B1I3]
MSPTAHSPFPSPHLPVRVHGSGRGIQPHRVDRQRGQLGATPGGDQQPFGSQRFPVTLKSDGELGAVMADLPCPSSREYGDSVRPQRLGGQLPGFRFLLRQQPVLSFDHCDHAREAGEDLGEFDTDGAPAEHDQRLRQLLGHHGIPVGPVRRSFEARHRGDPGPRAGSQHDAAPGFERAVADRHPAWAGETAHAPDEPAALGREAVGGGRIVPVVSRLAANAPGDAAPIRSHDRFTGEGRHPARLGEQIPGPDHHLAGHAPPVRTLAPDEFRLDPHHVQPSFGQRARDVLTTRPQPDDHHIRLLVRAHACFSSFPGLHGRAPAC